MLSKTLWKLLACIVAAVPAPLAWAATGSQGGFSLQQRSEERRVGKECA